MKRSTIKMLWIVGALVATGAVAARAADPEIEELKAQIKALTEKVNALEKQRVAPAPAAPGTNVVQVFSPSDFMKEIIGVPSPVQDRGNFNNNQDAAQRPNDLTLDPKYRGFIPVPNTPVLIKFNAKPRVDMTLDNRNSGNPDRFPTAQIPVQGQPEYGGSDQFNMNSRGSQLSVDVRAPEMEGNFRFYYNNDFFGSGSGMQYRLKQLYGQFYNFTAGFTYSVFEDPDAWPDTVDYEGPNSVIFARRPLARYMWQINDHWQMNFGIEQPGSEVSSTNAVTQQSRAPDGGFNVRWEDSKRGHVQAAIILRDIDARSPGGNSGDVLGWGVNLATSLNVFERDSVQGQFTYGEGIFRYFNDDFQNSDAAYDKNGDLEALATLGVMLAYTHHWSDEWRSTGSFGYVNIDNRGSQGPNAYHQTYYGSANVIWQIRKRLSIGLEGLYGEKEVQDGHTGSVWRFQLGMAYSLFD